MERRFTTSDGVTVPYLDLGPSSAPAVVLCHGLGAGAQQFAADAEAFAAAGYRVLVPNLRGHGGAGMPAVATPPAFSPSRLAADMTEMLDYADAGPVHWVGNSLGGIIGLTLAAKNGARLRSLALFGTALALALPARTGALLHAFDVMPGRAMLARITATSTTRERTARPLIERLLRLYDRRAAAAIVGHISRYDLRAAALGWQRPGLVLVGGRDHAVNRALHGQLPALRGRPNWRIETLATGGHCANLDATEPWRKALLRFWGEADA